MSRIFNRVVFGPIPVDLVEVTLEMELEPGNVVMSVGAQKHAYDQHPAEFWSCYPHIASIIANPLYLGDDHKNPDKIEFIGRPPGLGQAVLVAVELILDGDGCYNVCSFYPILERKVEKRKAKGFLKVARRK